MAGHWLAELDGSKVTVEVPASSANLGAGYDCLGVALAITDRIELEVRVWSRGEIELTVDGEGRNELGDDRDNRFVRGLEARAARRARGDPGWRRLADRDAQPDPAGARPRLVGGGDRRRHPGRQPPGRRGPVDGRDAGPRVRDRGPSRQCRGRAARRVRRVRPGRWRSGGDPLRLAARPAGGPVHPGAAPAHGRDARCAPRRRSRWPTRSPTSGRSRSESRAWRPVATTSWRD